MHALNVLSFPTSFIANAQMQLRVLFFVLISKYEENKFVYKRERTGGKRKEEKFRRVCNGFLCVQKCNELSIRDSRIKTKSMEE
jgi:hypothetical protein